MKKAVPFNQRPKKAEPVKGDINYPVVHPTPYWYAEQLDQSEGTTIHVYDSSGSEYLCTEIFYDTAELERRIDELCKADKVVLDEETSWVWTKRTRFCGV